MKWVVITGGGSGIGRTLVHHFSKEYKVLTCGRRGKALYDTKVGSTYPERVVVVEADIAKSNDRERFINTLPTDAELYLLIQNAAIGDPGELMDIDPAHLEYALQVNVVAPLALVQLLRRNLLHKGDGGRGGRVLHLGTSVAHSPQKGTLTYGITKKAFHRLYEQLNVEEGIVCGSISPGLVDTEGVQDHITKARLCNLPHVQYFDQAFKNDWTTSSEKLVDFIMELLQMDDATFISQEWKFSEWVKKNPN
mmetsp:Transcript_33053/g.37121  ORF Transcript_33053/g.37121 Transcript_33053/m.37121 type:complete len:251 (-) Transcript_33053:71-823(-)